MSGVSPQAPEANNWLTAREIAEWRLPGFPTSKRRVNALAAREGWPRRRRQGRGGGWEYPGTAESTLSEVLSGR